MADNATDLAQRHGGIALERNPAAVYLASLAESGRLTMLSKLGKAAGYLGYDDAFATPWPELRYQHVAALQTRMRDAGLAPSTINTTLCAVRGVMTAAFNLGLLDGEELERIRSVKPVRGSREPKGRSLNSRELASIIDTCCNAGGPGGIRDAALISLLYGAGLRREEVVAIDLEDWNREDGTLLIRGKGNKERTMFVSGGAERALLDWLRVRGEDPGPLFHAVNKGKRLIRKRMGSRAVWGIIKRRAKQARVKDFTPHDLRRTFVTDLLEAGADVVTVQKLAGHARVDTTAQYDRRGDDARRSAVGMLYVPYRKPADAIETDGKEGVARVTETTTHDEA